MHISLYVVHVISQFQHIMALLAETLEHGDDFNCQCCTASLYAAIFVHFVHFALAKCD